MADALVGLWRAIREHQVELITDVVERVTGRLPLSFAQWARENAAAFASPGGNAGGTGKK